MTYVLQLSINDGPFEKFLWTDSDTFELKMAVTDTNPEHTVEFKSKNEKFALKFTKDE